MNFFKVKDYQFRCFYDMTNPNFRNFMSKIVQSIEPYQ